MNLESNTTMYEIEHKYLIDVNAQFYFDLDTLLETCEKYKIEQGYVIDDSKQGILRVRINDGKQAFLTFKRSTKERGKNIEVEAEIPVESANLLMAGCERKITKTRHLIPDGDYTWEIDVFGGRLDGLIMAEIELHSENDVYHKPKWLGLDVTDDKRFSNYNLSVCDYKDLGL